MKWKNQVQFYKKRVKAWIGMEHKNDLLGKPESRRGVEAKLKTSLYKKWKEDVGPLICPSSSA